MNALVRPDKLFLPAGRTLATSNGLKRAFRSDLTCFFPFAGRILSASKGLKRGFSVRPNLLFIPSGSESSYGRPIKQDFMLYLDLRSARTCLVCCGCRYVYAPEPLHGECVGAISHVLSRRWGVPACTDAETQFARKDLLCLRETEAALNAL